MHRKPIAVGGPPPGRARGLGVSDALALELAPIQLPWLIEKLDQLRGPLEEELERERAARAASGEESTQDLEEKEYELRLLRMMRARLPGYPVHEPVVFVGPSGMVETVVRGVIRDIAAALIEIVSQHRPDERALHQAAAAASAWADTLAECVAVLAFNFDPAADPMEVW